MKEVLISIRPEWVAKILNGEKTIEIRKTVPNCWLPITAYIYCTKGKGRLVLNKEKRACLTGCLEEGDTALNGKVVAKFTLPRADGFDMENPCEEPTSSLLEKACVTLEQARTYANGKSRLYAWNIHNLEIFDEPRELDDFDYPNPSGTVYIGQRSLNDLPSKKYPPRSFCYIEID